MTRRVVITGVGGICPLGTGWDEVRRQLLSQKNKVCSYPAWGEVEGLQTRLGAPVTGFERAAHYRRKKIRTMGRVALLGTRATELALQEAGLLDEIANMDAGIAYGSTSGSPPSIHKLAAQVTVEHNLTQLSGSEYIKSMSHTVLSNIAQFFGMTGRQIPTCSACTSGSQAIGYAYECIKYGQSDVMLAGGAEELHLLAATVFDIMYATSTRNEEPHATPRPFDTGRDGLVVGEGACTMVLESLDHAQARGANIFGEITGFATNCDGAHIVSPSVQGMSAVMRAAFDDARISPDEVGYVCAHGTATEVGDIAESQATAQVFQRLVPISSLKSYMGHTLGACGALEAWMALAMMREGWFAPNINLEQIDERCAPLGFLTGVTHINTNYVMNNNFAFGGVNTSLILKRWHS